MITTRPLPRVAGMLLLLSCLPLSAQTPAVPAPGSPQDVVPGSEVRLVLATGDTLTGVIMAEDAESITLHHPTLGLLKVPKNALAPPAPPEPVVDVPVPEQAPPPSPWSGSLDFGLNGASGNTNQENLRTAFKAQHKTETRVIDLGFTYKRAQQDGEATEDNGLLEARVTWPEDDSPWGTFVGGSVERDRFKDYDHRLRVSGGRTYDFRDTEQTWLQGRFGLGASKDVGGDDDGWNPEGVLAIDYRHDVSETKRITASSEVFPLLNDLGEFRSISRAAWEDKLTETSPWVVKLGIEHKYDSAAADDVKATDWAYFASLGFSF